MHLLFQIMLLFNVQLEIIFSEEFYGNYRLINKLLIAIDGTLIGLALFMF